MTQDCEQRPKRPMNTPPLTPSWVEYGAVGAAILAPWLVSVAYWAYPPDGLRLWAAGWPGLGAVCACLPYAFPGRERPAAMAAATWSGLWFWLLLYSFLDSYPVYAFQGIYQGHGEIRFTAWCSVLLLWAAGLAATAKRPAYLRRSVAAALAGASAYTLTAIALACALLLILPFGMFR